METQAIVNIALELWGIAFCLMVAVLLVGKKKRHIAGFRGMPAICFFTIFLLAADCIAVIYRGTPGAAGRVIVKVSNYTAFYCNYALIISLIGYAMVDIYHNQSRKLHLFAIGLNFAEILLLGVNMFTGFLFAFDANNCYYRGPWYILTVIGSMGSLLVELVVLFLRRKDIESSRIMPMFAYLTLPFTAAIIQIFVYGYSFVYISYAASLILLFSVTGIENSLILAEQERRITETNTKLMLTQIQPHFMFNTLATIQSLCLSEPQEAAEVIADFSRYLRNNIDFSATTGMISFEKELSHVGSYVNIEKKRFGDRIQVIYELDYTEFKLPALVLQPMVENAIKHGLLKKKEGGTIRIITKHEGDRVTVLVCDNGAGFDVNAEPSKDRVHIGVSNVRDRIEGLCNGSFSITSVPGEGTTVTIVIPDNLE